MQTTIDVYNQLGSECCTTPSRLMYCVCNVQHGKAMQAPAPEPEGAREVDAAGRGAKTTDDDGWSSDFLGVDGAIGRPAGGGATSCLEVPAWWLFAATMP